MELMSLGSTKLSCLLACRILVDGSGFLLLFLLLYKSVAFAGVATAVDNVFLTRLRTLRGNMASSVSQIRKLTITLQIPLKVLTS